MNTDHVLSNVVIGNYRIKRLLGNRLDITRTDGKEPTQAEAKEAAKSFWRHAIPGNDPQIDTPAPSAPPRETPRDIERQSER